MSNFADVLEIKNGKNQRQVENPNGKYPIYGSGGVMGYANDFLCEAGTVIIGRKGTINNPIYVNEPFWNVDTAFGLVAKRDILFPKYLYYFCKKYDFEKLNTTVTIPSLTKSNLLQIEIPLPPLPIQQKIADIIDHANTLIEKRKEQIAKLDLLVKSQFNEMFGNYYSDKTAYKKLKEVCNFIDYRGKTPEKSDDGIPLITAKNVKENTFSIEPQEFIPEANYSNVMTRGIPIHNDVLFTTEAPLGNVCRIPPIYDRFCVGQRLITMQPIATVLVSEYLERALFSQDFRDKMMRRSSGSTVVGIRSKELIELTLPMPPLHLQVKYADFVQQIDKSKFEMQQGLEKLELLYKSLMQKCFAGELF